MKLSVVVILLVVLVAIQGGGADAHGVDAGDEVTHTLVLRNPTHLRIYLPNDILEILGCLAEAAGAGAVGTLAELLPSTFVED